MINGGLALPDGPDLRRLPQTPLNLAGAGLFTLPNLITLGRLCAVLDPIADKALLVSVYVTLAAIGVLPDWLAILVVFRDLLIVGGVLVLWAVGLPPRIKPIFISKANTAAQIVLAALVLLLAGFGFSAPLLLEVMIWLVATTTFASGAAYVAQAARRTAGWTA